MPKPTIDKSIPPPLRALGGWEDADWFCPTILSSDEVVGMSLPKLAGCRKQTFHLVERSVPQPTPKRRAPVDPVVPKRVAATFGQVLDGLGVLRAAAFRKPSFFFEAAPTLYFADIQAAKLKARAADALRRDLIRTSFRGCVVRYEADCVTAMFWPRTEHAITAFISAAAPPHALHSQFDDADIGAALPEPGMRHGTKRGAAAAQPSGDTRALQAERKRMLAELQVLRDRIAELQQSQSALGAMETLGLDDSRLRAMLLLLHPDRHANSAAANEAAKWINGLRDLLKSGRG